MIRRGVLWAWVLVACAAAVVLIAARSGSAALDPAEVSGAAPDTCFDCKDVDCGYCPSPVPCHHMLGYCYETVRNLSQFCAPNPSGKYQMCKTLADPKGSCVMTLLNPCTSENVVCNTPIAGCGPQSRCILEGVCPH